MKKLLLSIATIALVGGLGFMATTAFFSDEEKSVGNTFVAGAVDLKIDSQAHYAGMYCDLATQTWFDEGTKSIDPQNSKRTELLGRACTGTWELTDLDENHTFFDYADIKPGDEGENTVSLHVYNNDTWACATINPTFNDDMSSTEPELEAGDVADTENVFDGELAQYMVFEVWADMCNIGPAIPGDNIRQTEGDCIEPILTSGTGFLTPLTFALADSNSSVFANPTAPLTGDKIYYLGVKWSLPDTVGNIVQTDKYMADISFDVVQSRNNPDFKCPTPSAINGEGTRVLRLENEEAVTDGPWRVLSGDQKYVDMTYNTSGPTFDYSLVGQGLASSTSYDLIYYADGWPGNHPGALIGTHPTDASGNINIATINKELDMNLPTSPDTNLAVGAKIWLIPSDAYDDANKSVIVWPPNFDTWFFEGNVYIHYDDTEIP